MRGIAVGWCNPFIAASQRGEGEMRGLPLEDALDVSSCTT